MNPILLYSNSAQDVPGLKLWLDANTILQSNNTSVTTWNDLTSNQVNFTQNTSAAKPTLQTNAINGKSIVRFDGVDDFMEVLDSTKLGLLRNLAGCTIFAVHKINAGVNQQTIFQAMRGGANTAGARSAIGISSSDFFFYSGRRLDADTAAQLYSVQNANNTVKVHTSLIDWSNTTGYQYINGATDGFSTTFLTAGNSGDTDSVVIKLGAQDVTSISFAAFDLGELLIYNRTLKTVERKAIERYLASKWGVTLA